MSKALIIVIVLLVLGVCGIIIFNPNSLNYKINNLSNNSSTENLFFTIESNLSLFIEPNYSNKGYFIATPQQNEERFILIQCINSTLEITNTTIGCKK